MHPLPSRPTPLASRRTPDPRRPHSSPDDCPADSVGSRPPVHKGHHNPKVLALDTELRFLYVNPHLAGVDDVPAEEHQGRTLTEVVPQVQRPEEVVLQVLLDGRPRLSRVEYGRGRMVGLVSIGWGQAARSSTCTSWNGPNSSMSDVLFLQSNPLGHPFTSPGRPPQHPSIRPEDDRIQCARRQPGQIGEA